MKINTLKFSALAIASSLVLYACTKDEVPTDSTPESAKTQLNIRLKDAPADLDSVVVEILEVKVKIDSDSTSSDSGWVSLTTNAGQYDLLQFQNGLDTLLATGTIPQDTLKQVRFMLGSNNYVVDTAGVIHPLTIPSGAESGLKLNLSRLMGPTLNTITIDFDTDASIHRTGNGRYMLRPVLILQ